MRLCRHEGRVAELENLLIMAIYGSNYIESAGNNYDITAQLCKAVFRDESPDPEITLTVQNLSEYYPQVRYLRRENRPSDHESVVKSRREIIQHAKAFAAVIRFIMDGNEWTEDAILQTHEILHDGLDDDVLAGTYRHYEVAVKYEEPGQRREKASICLRARAVPAYMRDMVGRLNKMGAEMASDMPPFDRVGFAVRFHHQFVNIHPFGDGNGRMARIITNALLLTYAGRILPIGMTSYERRAYLMLCAEASRIFREEDMEVDFAEQTGHLHLAEAVGIWSRQAPLPAGYH
ncbi:fido domain-containing protein [Podospora didyma]|uniref:Fido domain-containing protein n=1 Tax=Podospora didyma TaxID=330526 RepID=A0AAE0N1R9_9PEZI|nr:fido domain-containing protein [Podospora didyma]